MSRRVVVTGLGTVNPLANDVKDFWERTKKGENGIERITRFDVSTYTSQVGGEVKNFDPNNYMDKKDARRMDKFALFALVSAQEAMADAKLKTGENMDPEQLGVMLGNGIGGLEPLEDQI